MVAAKLPQPLSGPFLALVVEIPNLEAMTPEDFAWWCAVESRYHFFDSVLGWPEGYVYCKRFGYAEKTGYFIARRLLEAR